MSVRIRHSAPFIGGLSFCIQVFVTLSEEILGGTPLYGLVNKAIHDLVVSEHGEEAWLGICNRAGITTTRFVALQSYPDDITYALVGEVARTLRVPPSEVLKAFGKYWVKFTGREGHQDAFDLFPKGKEGLISFLENLDDLHARMMMAMPDLRPPQIVCERKSENEIRVHYVSQRAGLGPMVIGLMDGLMDFFEVSGEVTHFPMDVKAGREHDEFHVAFQA